MSLAKIRAALETALNAMSPALPTIWQNDPATEPASGPYQRCDLLMAQPTNAETGARSIKQGVLQVTLCWPLGVNTAGVDARCDLIEQAFPRGLSLASGSTVVTINRTAWVLPGYRDAGRWCVPVRISFWSQQAVGAEQALQAQIGAYALGLGFTVHEISDAAYVLTDADKGRFLAFTSPYRTFVYVDAGLSSGFSCAVCKAGSGDVTVWRGTAEVTFEGGNHTLSETGGFGVVRSINPGLALFQLGDSAPEPVVLNRTLFDQPEASGLVALLLT